MILINIAIKIQSQLKTTSKPLQRQNNCLSNLQIIRFLIIDSVKLLKFKIPTNPD